MTDADLEQRKQILQDSGLVDWLVFSELIAMDEDEAGFLKLLFETFVEQVIDTFQEIDTSLKDSNLENLLLLGHYLKGLAAALGLILISTECERIQNYGKKINFDLFDIEQSVKENPNKEEISKDEVKKVASLSEKDDEFWIYAIKDAVNKAKDEYSKVKEVLDAYFEEEI